MARYRKVEVRTWADDKFMALSPMPPSGRGLWLFLMTGPHTSQVPGLFRAGRLAMAEELEWSPEQFDERFAELFEKGMAKADFKARIVWLPNALKHNPPENPNVVKSWRDEIDLLPDCPLKAEALEAIRAYLETRGDAFVYALFGDVRKAANSGSSNGLPNGSANRSSKGMPNQEQEQEQEQEEAKSSLRSDSSSPEAGSSVPADPLALTAEPAPPADLRARKAQRIQRIAEDARDAYNRLLAKPNGELAACTVLNKPRVKAVEKALPTCRAICQQLYGNERVTAEFWQALFETAADDDFHAGRIPGGPGHENWKPDFEYLLREAVIAKLFDRAMSQGAAA